MAQFRRGPTVDELERLTPAFEARLKAARAAAGDLRWYPYRSLTNFGHLGNVLTGERRRLLDLAGDLPVADIGCADGELSFFLESQGLSVHAYDWPETNQNGLTGIAALKGALGSAIEIHPLNLDRDFTLVAPRYGLGFFLGTLYHLKNPYHALEGLSRQVRYLVLSTRVASVTPRGTNFADEPLAYLLGDDEANRDWTNYWIFSAAGLRRLLQRTGWRVLDFGVIGDAAQAEPGRLDLDARAFTLAAGPLAYLEERIVPLNGWHRLEEGCWRWTAGRFSADVHAGGDELLFYFGVHPALFAASGSVTLSASANGAPLPPETYQEPGFYCYRARVPGVTAGEVVRLEFAVEPALPSSEADWRELGLMVYFDKEHAPDGRATNDPIILA